MTAADLERALEARLQNLSRAAEPAYYGAGVDYERVRLAKVAAMKAARSLAAAKALAEVRETLHVSATVQSIEALRERLAEEVAGEKRVRMP